MRAAGTGKMMTGASMIRKKPRDEIAINGALPAGRQWIKLGLIGVVWTVVGLTFTAQVYFATYSTEKPVELARALFSEMSWCYLWALATPLALWLARRYRIERSNWKRHLLVHLFASIALVITIAATHSILFYLHYQYALGRPYMPMNTVRSVLYNFSEGMAPYWLIILCSHAYSYYNRYQQGELRASRLEARLAQAQLHALKMQLHPHFLFNTLHSVSALLHRDTEAADRMITRLGDFLRMTLENAGTQAVTLQQELEFLRCYLEIERVRFQDRLSTYMEVEPRALDAYVPNLILQPIVENAIRHGIAPRSAPGRIEIHAEQKDTMLRIQVRDNGPGLPANLKATNFFKEGLGLANTRARLEQLYGAAHSFEIANDPSGGLVVTLEIPSEVGLLRNQTQGWGADDGRDINAGADRR
jgi:sensor histidine kinase YesM